MQKLFAVHRRIIGVNRVNNGLRNEKVLLQVQPFIS